MTEYFFEHDWQHERERLRQLELFYDPMTQENLEWVGIQPGWRCLEVGAGGGSIAEWLAWRVGPTGRVLAIDLQTRFIEPLAGPNLEVRQHRMGSDALPGNHFDLVHARAVMEHQPDRVAVLAQMYDCLRPGGWLVLESADFTPVAASRPGHAKLFCRVWDQLKLVLEERGFSWECGRYLSLELESVGFEDVSYDGRVFEWGGDDGPLTMFYLQTFERLGMGLQAHGVSNREFKRFLTMCKGSTFRATSHITCAVAGRKPRRGA